MKYWQNDDFYNFSIEFNRIEMYNEYCVEWLKYYGISAKIESKTNWTYNDIPDINDFNRIKSNINIILGKLEIARSLNISTQFNQSFDSNKANEMERALEECLVIIGEFQFAYNITGLTISGNNLKIGGVE